VNDEECRGDPPGASAFHCAPAISSARPTWAAKARIANQERLRALKLNHGDRVMVVDSHDPVDYEHCRCGGH
jgi:hypothetical protein